MDFDLSIPPPRAWAAPRTRVFWSDIDHWGNPALLGYAHGVRYIHTRSQVAPGLPARVFLMSDVVRIGGGGIGLVSSGKPFESGGVLLDYGTRPGPDPFGNPTSSFRSFERVQSTGIGVSLLRLVESGYRTRRRRLTGMESIRRSLRRHELEGSPDRLLAPDAFGSARTSARDWGLHARVTPRSTISTGRAASRYGSIWRSACPVLSYTMMP